MDGDNQTEFTQMPQPIIHRGFDAFARGRFDDGGSNLYVNAKGAIETIHRTDMNNDGYVDIVISNHHGYIERGPTWIYKPGVKRRSDGATERRTGGVGREKRAMEDQHAGSEGNDSVIREESIAVNGSGNGGAEEHWSRRQLPNDSSWMSRIVDVDGDGHADLIVANGENGVTSELESYVYWGGPDGLSGQRTEFATKGAYDVAAVDLTGNGLLDLIFPTAWVDHHNGGKPMDLLVHLQTAPRRFEDATARFGLKGIAATSLACGDLTGDGRPDLVVANYREGFMYDVDSFVYWGRDGGFDSKSPLRLPTHFALHAVLGDLNDDGFDEIIFCGGHEIRIYWNDAGRFDPSRCTTLKLAGFTTMFCLGAVNAAVADVDGDGCNELIVVGEPGVQIRHQSDLNKVRQELALPDATWVHAADLDGDGRPEIIASCYHDRVNYETHSAIFWNGPDGFSPDRVTLVPTTGAMGCTAGDLDGDGHPVVVFNNTMGGPSQLWVDFPIYVYLGNERAEYSQERRLEFPTGGSYSYILADLTLDGYPDLACVTPRQILRIFPGGPEGPRPDRYFDLPTRCQDNMDVLVADLNRDGYLDLITVAYSNDDRPEARAAASTIYYGSEEGYSVERSVNFPTNCFGLGHLADVNGDGYLDIIVVDRSGCVLIYLGGPDGYSQDRVWRVPLPMPRGGFMNVADLNGNGYLDLIVGMVSHYSRRQETLCIFYGGPDGYDPSRAQYLSSGYSAHTLTVGDMNNDGHLDLYLPAYSTNMTRELPAYIYWGDGNQIDLEKPLILPAQSPTDAMMIDLSRNGYQDLVVSCHRNNLGHQVESLIYWNGPDGMSPQRVTRLPGMGPHQFTTRDHGNAHTRQPQESYISPPFELNGARPRSLNWEAEIPPTNALRFQLRWAGTRDGLESAAWLGPEGEGTCYESSGGRIGNAVPKARWLQYKADFVSLYGCGSPKLHEVRIEMADS